MPDFDKQRIIQGTPSKRIRLAHAALLESPSEENVEHLYETYSEMYKPCLITPDISFRNQKKDFLFINP